MKTGIYIDGFNLYYGLLKHGPYKWLNIRALFSEIVKERVPESDIIECGFYTAMVKAKISSKGEASVRAQQVYHCALRSIYTPLISVVCSDHSLEQKPLMRVRPGKPPNKMDRVTVWKLEEKQTDVRLALDAYRGARELNLEHVVIVSNDSDLIPAFEALKNYAPDVHRGIIAPRKNDSGRALCDDLRLLANWNRSHINDDELARHQFPDKVPTKKRPAFKPDHW